MLLLLLLLRHFQILFEIQSTLLNDALTKGNLTTASLSFSVDPTTNYIQLKATDDGVIEKIDYRADIYFGQILFESLSLSIQAKKPDARYLLFHRENIFKG